jgi:oligopeptide transport system permease protein
MMRLAPGSPFSTERGLPPQIVEKIEAEYCLNKPMHEQYFTYLGNILQGDFGPSFKYKDYSVNELIEQALPVSATIGLLAFIFTTIVGVGIGTLAALKQNTWLDYSVMSTAMLGVIMPSFVLAPVLIYVFSIELGWLPAGGWHGGSWQYILLPMLSMSLLYIASFARITRGSMIETLNSNFIRTAKAKGLPFSTIVLRHALRPALLPVLSYMGPAFVGIITGSVVIETIFGLPGLGKLFVNGALNRDYSLVLGLTILIGFLTITFNAIVDILLAAIDPKIRYE